VGDGNYASPQLRCSVLIPAEAVYATGGIFTGCSPKNQIRISLVHSRSLTPKRFAECVQASPVRQSSHLRCSSIRSRCHAAVSFGGAGASLGWMLTSTLVVTVAELLVLFNLSP
jgi:hypothetical protein